MSLEFSERQSRTVAAAATTLASLVILIAIGLLGWLARLPPPEAREYDIYTERRDG